MSDIMYHLPAVALRGTTILPDMIVHFDVSREKSIQAIEQAMVQDQRILLITQKNPETEEPVQEDLYPIGTIAEIKQLVKLPKNIVRVLVEGIEKAQLVSLEENPNYLEAQIAVFEPEEDLDETVKEAMLRSIKELFVRYCNSNKQVSKELAGQILELEDVEKVLDQISIHIQIRYEERQKILEAVSLEDRYEIVGMILTNEIQIMEIGAKLQSKVKERVDKNQREYILREQLKVIREELGEDNSATEAEQFLETVKKLKAKKDVKERITKEINRFKNTVGSPAESGVIRTYIETLLSLPWDKTSRDNKNLQGAYQILEDFFFFLFFVFVCFLFFLAVLFLFF